MVEASRTSFSASKRLNASASESSLPLISPSGFNSLAIFVKLERSLALEGPAAGGEGTANTDYPGFDWVLELTEKLRILVLTCMVWKSSDFLGRFLCD